MTLLVRDEIDIVEKNLSFHLESGVDHIVVIDNGSIDGTRDVLADWARSGPVTVFDEAKQNFDQSAWMTNAAIIARDDLGADWVLNNDADEFWVSRDGSIKDQLRKTKASVLLCPRVNMFYPWDDDRDEPWVASCIYRVGKPVKLPKMADRLTDRLPCPYFYLYLPGKILTKVAHLEKIDYGNHRAIYKRAIFRRKARTEPGEIDIYHYPVRSQRQFNSKVVNGGEAFIRNTLLPPTVGWHWRRWHRMLQTQGIDAALADALPCKAALMHDLTDGIVIEDHRMKSRLNGLE